MEGQRDCNGDATPSSRLCDSATGHRVCRAGLCGRPATSIGFCCRGYSPKLWFSAAKIERDDDRSVVTGHCRAVAVVDCRGAMGDGRKQGR